MTSRRNDIYEMKIKRNLACVGCAAAKKVLCQIKSFIEIIDNFCCSIFDLYSSRKSREAKSLIRGDYS